MQKVLSHDQIFSCEQDQVMRVGQFRGIRLPINAFAQSALPFINDQNKHLKRNLVENGVHFHHQFGWIRKRTSFQFSFLHSEHPKVSGCEIEAV
jgi:hypothetical protein